MAASNLIEEVYETFQASLHEKHIYTNGVVDRKNNMTGRLASYGKFSVRGWHGRVASVFRRAPDIWNPPQKIVNYP